MVHASLMHVYHMTEAVYAVEDTHCIQDRMIESMLNLSSKLMFYTVTEKYLLECVFVS